MSCISSDCCEAVAATTFVVAAVSTVALLATIIILAAGKSTFVAKMGAQSFSNTFNAVAWACLGTFLYSKCFLILMAGSR